MEELYGNCLGPIIFLLIIVLIILLWAIYLSTRHGEDMAQNDPLNKKIIDIPIFENCCSWWPISHFIIFFVVGILFPNSDLIAIPAGILWEIIEMVIADFFGRQRQGMVDNDKIEYSENWWSGSFKDIVFDIVGFYLGKSMAYTLNCQTLYHDTLFGSY